VNRIKIGLSVLLLSLGAQSHAAIINFDGDATPDSTAYAADFTTVVFGGTSWSSDGDILTMITAPSRGIWFGYSPSLDTPSGYAPAGNIIGNSLSARMRTVGTADDWNMYMYDGDGHSGGLSLFDGYVQLYSAGYSQNIALDTNIFHDYQVHLKNNIASFIIDGALVSQVATTGTSAGSLFLIGDSSGGTPTGTGSFQVDSFTIDTAPDDLAFFVSEASSIFLIALSIFGVAYQRRRLK
jgi:hypothetical protein